jgi:hypothetical protein
MFQETVSAICYEICDFHDHLGDSPVTGPPYNDVAEFVLEQWARMPDFLRVPIRAFTVVFALSAVVRRGRLYYRNDMTQRRIQRLAWRTSFLSPFRDLMRFYESLAILAMHSRPLSRAGSPDAV